MKLLKVKIPTGYKMLAKDFEINFLTKTRVDKEVDNNNLLELENDFYYPIETVFIGKNSSGKSTTIELLGIIFGFLRTGRIDSRFFDNTNIFELNLILYSNGFLYEYKGSFKKEISKATGFLTIENESLEKTTLKASYKKDLSNASFFKDSDFIPTTNSDTSGINKIISNQGFNYLVDPIGYKTYLFETFFELLGKSTFEALLHLFDDSIKSIEPHIGANGEIDGFLFERVYSQLPSLVVHEYLENVLSKGTIRGINLYGFSILAFKNGGTIVVDEIEKSFNRNLIENLLLMFNDPSINKRGASIIYSTHYSELLDGNNRCDNVNVLHRNESTITLMNMSKDYDCRTDMLKSSQFNQNTFDTLINYDKLMTLKETLR